jgi:hypothetical protein
VLNNIRTIRNSGSYQIFILRLLSGITDVMLRASCSAAMERVQWMLVSRRHGLVADSYISLSTSTGIMGLLVLAFGASVRNTATRCFALLRLIIAILCPTLAILIMCSYPGSQRMYRQSS